MTKPPNPDKPRCPKCGSAWTYYRIYREHYFCRACQHIWIPDDNKEETEVKVASTNVDAKD